MVGVFIMSRRLKAAFARVYATDPDPHPGRHVSAFERSVCAKSHGVLARPPPRMDGHVGGKGQVGRELVDPGDATSE